MKKILILLVIFLLSTPVYATQFEVTSDSENDTFESEHYIPEYVKGILNENGADVNENTSVSEIFEYMFYYLKESADKYIGVITNLIGIIMFTAIIKKINDNNGDILILDCLSGVIIANWVLTVFQTVCKDAESLLSETTELLGVLLPSFTAVTLLGGGTISSATASASFATVLVLLEVFLSGVIQAMVTVMVVMSVFEHISPSFSEFNVVKTVKKYTLMLITLITTIMMTVLSYQNIISARADSVSMRTAKFAAANFIPIVGNAVGDSLKTVTQGVAYLKASVGGASALALFFTVAPFILDILFLKIMLSFAGFTASVSGCGGEGGYISSCVNILDILMSIIICVSLLSFLLIYLFSVTAFGV